MASRFFKKPAFLILLVFSVFIGLRPEKMHAQEKSMFSQKLQWKGDSSAFEYKVEIRDSSGKTNSFTTEKNFIEFSLPSGDYDWRVTAYDFLGREATKTSWKKFTIKKAIAPTVKAKTEKIVINTEKELSVPVSAEKVEDGAKIELVNKKTNKAISGTIKNGEAIFKKVEDGDYSVRITNPSGLSAETVAINIREKSEEEIKAEEARRLAEEQRIAEEKRLEEERLAEQKRIEEENRRLEQERLAEEKRIEQERIAEQKRIKEERLAEQERLAEENRRLEQERLAEEKRLAEQERLAEEQRLAEQKRIEEENRRLEQERLAEEKRIEQERIAEQKRIEEEKQRLEQERLAEEKRLAEEEKRLEEQRKRDEEFRLEEHRIEKERVLAEKKRQEEEEKAKAAERLEKKLARQNRPPDEIYFMLGVTYLQNLENGEEIISNQKNLLGLTFKFEVLPIKLGPTFLGFNIQTDVYARFYHQTFSEETRLFNPIAFNLSYSIPVIKNKFHLGLYGGAGTIGLFQEVKYSEDSDGITRDDVKNFYIDYMLDAGVTLRFILKKHLALDVYAQFTNWHIGGYNITSVDGGVLIGLRL